MTCEDPSSKLTNVKMEVLEGEEREKGEEKIFQEIMDYNFPNLMKDMNLHIQKAQ